MSDCCDSVCASASLSDHTYRRILYIVLTLNVIMLVVESIAGYTARSTALQADAIDFLGDSLNFISALYVLNKPPHWKSKAALIKGGVIGLFGLFVLGNMLYHWLYSSLPHAETMGIIGVVALLVNLSCAGLLFKFRKGDSNRSSVWICSRNDSIANIAVITSAYGVYLTNSKWPDLLVAVFIASLAFSGARNIIRKALAELRMEKT